MVNRPLVFVALGTDHHPFHRLVQWSAELAAENTSVQWFVQTGFTPSVDGLEGAEMLTVQELEKTLESARAVVTHGGPGLILEARAAGHVPIVVPRDPGMSEHVDNHQQLFTQRLADADRIRRVTTLPDFRAAIASTLLAGPVTRSVVDGAPSEGVVRFGRLVESLVSGRRKRSRKS